MKGSYLNLRSKIESFMLPYAIKMTCTAFLMYNRLCVALTKTPFAGGGLEILYGTALLPEKGFFVADVGAYKGWYTTLCSKMVGPNGCVYSFEPEPNNFQMLHKVVWLNQLRNVKLFKLALSDKDGFESLYLSKHPSMHSTTLIRSNNSISVPCMRLDTLSRLHKIAKIDLIKVDVEGAELKVLKGMQRTINEFEPIFSIDVLHYEGEFEEISSFMREFNYEIRPLFCKEGKPYSIVMYPPHKKSLAEYLINKTRKLSIRS